MSMDQQEKLLSYNGILLLFQLSRGNNSQSDDITITTLHVKRMTFDNGTKLFNEVSTGSLCIYGEDIEIIHCSNASDFRTGILHPYILLKKKKKKKIKYVLLLFHTHNKFELVLQFKLDYAIKEPVKLLAGPTIIWYYEGHLLHISPQTGTVLCAPIQFSSIQWAGQVEGEGIVVLGTKAAGFPGDNKQNNARSDLAIWGYECFAYGVDKQKVLSNASFLPHAYGSVVRCVYVCKIEVKSKFKTSLIAVTCKGQLIFFQDGWPKHLLQLPYENPFSVQIAAVDGDRQLVIVTFASGDVCAIWKHNLQVASCWKNVNSVLVDDFAGIGTEQILVFLKSDSISETLKAFQITDFGNINYESNINYENDLSSAEEIQENHLLTIKALEARLQAGFASVRAIQQHLRLKEKVLMQSCHALLNLVQGCKQGIPRINKENLVSLWDETEEGFHNGVLTPTEDEEQIVKKVWYRVVDDQLIVGVEVMETFDFRQLSDASLSLIIGQKHHLLSPSKCHCRVVTLTKASEAEPLSCWHLEPLPKKLKLSCLNEESKCNRKGSEVKRNKAKAITAVTHLFPFLAWHEITCVVLLHAKKSSNSENWQKSKRLTLLCGNFLLSLVEISTGKLSINLKEYKYPGSTEDLLAVCAISHKASFQIISDCTLLPVNKRLLEQMECAPIEKYPGYMVCWKSGNLNGTLFKWNLKTHFEGFLTVFCRHQLALFQCLHAFIGLLPPTCKIKLLKLGNKNLLAEQLALILIKEAEFFQHVLSSALKQTENKFSLKNEGNKENNSASAVEHFKETFIKEQKQSMLSMNRTVSGSLFRKHIVNVFDLQMNSDMISWLCS
ncbi:Fanconi anemia group B protein isoform X1 [Notechis scutatus]|uniref:Fanconi anemia group B protein isoform X1 n=1 Tax=Notechis scutatus TaxID=8663 RepID=A0A6J1TWE7_9SAUR|nr:Fanconi anemia group B protein isoform X1 [Notechis scutatus]XP_026522722.1 Fanconi anemia group B protein isoform X1 [Notechis scutatus]